MEGEALDHDSFLWVLPDRQGALGLQQVVNLLVVHLEGGARSEAELCSPSSEQREAPSIGITPDPIRRPPPSPQHPAGHFPGVTRSSRGCSKCRGRLSRALLASHRASAPLQPSEPGGADCYADRRHRGVSASKRNFPGSRWGRGREEPAAPVHPAAQVSLVPAALWAPGAPGGLRQPCLVAGEPRRQEGTRCGHGVTSW